MLTAVQILLLDSIHTDRRDSIARLWGLNLALSSAASWVTLASYLTSL